MIQRQLVELLFYARGRVRPLIFLGVLPAKPRELIYPFTVKMSLSRLTMKTIFRGCCGEKSRRVGGR